MLRIYTFHTAPDMLQALSTHGGDEDWIVVCPSQFVNAYWPNGLDGVFRGSEDSYVMGWGHVDRHVLESGEIVVIFAHA